MRRESGKRPNVLLTAAGLSRSFCGGQSQHDVTLLTNMPIFFLVYYSGSCYFNLKHTFSIYGHDCSHCISIVNHGLPWNNFPLLSGEGRAKERRVRERGVTPRSDVFRTLTQTGLRERHTVVSVSSYLPLEIVLAPTMTRI